MFEPACINNRVKRFSVFLWLVELYFHPDYPSDYSSFLETCSILLLSHTWNYRWKDSQASCMLHPPTTGEIAAQPHRLVRENIEGKFFGRKAGKMKSNQNIKLMLQDCFSPLDSSSPNNLEKQIKFEFSSFFPYPHHRKMQFVMQNVIWRSTFYPTCFVNKVEVCKSLHTKSWLSALYAYKGLLLVVGVYMAWETRHVKIPALNDSQYIGFSVYGAVITSVSVVVLANLLSEQVTLAFIIITSIILTSTTATLCLVFLPKMNDIWKKGEAINWCSPFMTSRSIHFLIKLF